MRRMRRIGLVMLTLFGLALVVVTIARVMASPPEDVIACEGDDWLVVVSRDGGTTSACIVPDGGQLTSQTRDGYRIEVIVAPAERSVAVDVRRRLADPADVPWAPTADPCGNPFGGPWPTLSPEFATITPTWATPEGC